MGRKAKFETKAERITLALPEGFLKNKPTKYLHTGDWLWDLIQGNIQTTITKDSKPSISETQKIAVKFFYDIFNSLFEKGKLDKVIEETPEIMDYAKAFEEVTKL